MKNDEVPGNARGSTLAFQQLLLDQGVALREAEHVFDRMFNADTPAKSVRVRLPVYEGQEYLAVVNAEVGGVPMVGFHSAPTFADALLGLLRRLDRGSIKWKEDKYGG